MKTYKTSLLHCEVLVAGGGPAGVACAIAAARQGAKVILCQDRPVLGGNASSEVRMHIVGANGGDRPGKDAVLETRETGIVEEIRLENAVRNPQRSPSMADLILYEKCRAEPNLTVLLNTSVVAATVQHGAIAEIEALRSSTEDRLRIVAHSYVDCTGDGGLGAAAGAAYFQGREGRAVYGESLATETGDAKTLGSTILFMARKHPRPVPFIAPPWARKFSPDDFRLRGCVGPPENRSWEYGFWWIEWGGHLDTIKQNEAIRDELLAIVLGIWDYIKNRGDHGAEHWALDWFGAIPGKRESRRFKGQHVLSETDLLQSRPFPDAIAYGGWPIDVHPPEGIDARDTPPATQTSVPLLYDIPLRSCVAAEIANLMFAGRNISASHIAFASTRVMATCSAMGEGVGIAAAYAAKQRLAPAELAGNTAAMQAIRERILREDGYLIGASFDDRCNLLHTGSLHASSAQPAGPASNILSGQNRAIYGPRGVEPRRECPGTHRWMSEPGLPAWVAVRWETAQTFSTIELVFDTGLHRHLALTFSNHYFQKMVWGQGQPETVKDFTLELETDTGWEQLCKVEGNWQRRWKYHAPAPLRSRALRLIVSATWGLDHARVVNWRIY